MSEAQSRSRSRSPINRDRDYERMKSDLAKMKNDILRVENKVYSVEQRVIRNEAHSRSRNVRIYGLAEPTDKQTDLKPILKDVLTAGLKLGEEMARDILHAVDALHFTPDSALIVAFSKRIDRGILLKHRKNLEGYKPNGKSISLNVDLTKEAYLQKKARDKKFTDYKAATPGANIKKLSFDKIIIDGEILHHSHVIVHVTSASNVLSGANRVVPGTNATPTHVATGATEDMT